MVRQRKTSDRERISARAPVDHKVVKSARRVLEVLEYFDDVQREATVMEIADTLGYPQSSTSALLRSLVAMGYLNHDALARTYVSSNRVSLLGSWVNSEFFVEGAIISLLKQLNEQTGDTVVLAARNGRHVQYIHVIQATSPVRLHMTLGTVRPIAASGAGYAMLSTMSDTEITRVVMRINAEAPEGHPLIRIRDLLEEIAVIRQKGYAFTCDMVTAGGGIIAAPLPRVGAQQRMVVGIGGISEMMRGREEELSSILRAGIAAWFGSDRRTSAPVPVGSNLLTS